MNLKERIENNLAIFFIGTIIIGFTAGFGAYQAISEITKPEAVSNKEIIELKNEIEEKYDTEMIFLKAEINELKNENQKLKNKNNELINDYRSEVEKLKTMLNQSEVEKKEFMNEKSRLAKEREVFNDIKIAQNYMDKYLNQYAHVNLIIDEKQLTPENKKDYHAAKSLLNALESVARTISDDNRYLDFVHDQLVPDGGPVGTTGGS